MSSEYNRVDVRGTVGFVILAYVPAWLLTVPMWSSGEGLSWSWTPVLLVAMMFTPALATLVTTRWISPSRSIRRDTGLTSPGGFRRWWPYALLGWLAAPATMLLALFTGWALGVYEANWTDLSDLPGQLQFSLTDSGSMSTGMALLALAVQVLVFGWLNVIPAFAEEWGWRGYLTPALLPLGQPGAFLVTGVLWGLWHAPILVLGYNYPTVPEIVSFLMMIVFCTLVGTLLGWLRLVSRSVWPAAIGHGFLNASALLPVVFNGPGKPVSNVSVGVLGWSGWLVLGLLILVLVGLRWLPVRFPARATGISRGVRRLSRK